MARLGRTLDVTLPMLAAIVLMLVWVHLALALFTESSLPHDTWAWLEGLELIPAALAWLALLPLGVFLWAWQAELEPIWFSLVMALLMGWTFLAWSSSMRAMARRHRRG